MCPAQAQLCPQGCPAMGTCVGREETSGPGGAEGGPRMPLQTVRLLLQGDPVDEARRLPA